VQNVVDEFGRSGPPWESPEEAGTVRGLIQTLYGSLFSPTKFFSSMRRSDGYLTPLIYAVILGSFAILVSIGWECLFIFRGDVLPNSGSGAQLGALRPISYGLTAILSPLLIAFLVIVSSAVYHLILLILGGGAQGFQTSFRVVCYSQGAGVCNIVPLFGAAVGGIWNIVLLVIGLKESHQTAAWKAGVAVIVPIVIWSVLLMAMILMVTRLGL